ncbi:MAG: hypothetical protein IT329_23210 [Caldilineaceae bacterium]|nr:hypothetical protein [Caldilineaceae bacterium]
MDILVGILLVVWGVALMAFGLWLFYALLPLWYGLFGGVAGFTIGTWMTGGANGWLGGTLTWTLAIVGAALFAALAYSLEPFRRILAGLLMGFSLGSLVAALFGGGVFVTMLFGGVGALIFAVLVPLFFDPLIVVGSSFSGAALVMDGLYLILPFLGFALNRTNAANQSNWLAIVVYIVLGAVGLAWQLSNLRRWVQAEGYALGRSPTRSL